MIEKIQSLPTERIAEVEDFVDFLKQRTPPKKAAIAILLVKLAGLPTVTYAADGFTVVIDVTRRYPVGEVEFVLKGSKEVIQLRVKNGSNKDRDNKKTTVTIFIPFRKDEIKWILDWRRMEGSSLPPSPTVNPIPFEDEFGLLPEEELFDLRFYGLEAVGSATILAAVFDSDTYSSPVPTFDAGDILSVDTGIVAGFTGVSWVDISAAFTDVGAFVDALATPASVDLKSFPTYTGDAEVVWSSRFIANISEPPMLPMLLGYGLLLIALKTRKRGQLRA